jgi:hypothetical protein
LLAYPSNLIVSKFAGIDISLGLNILETDLFLAPDVGQDSVCWRFVLEEVFERDRASIEKRYLAARDDLPKDLPILHRDQAARGVHQGVCNRYAICCDCEIRKSGAEFNRTSPYEVT